MICDFFLNAGQLFKFIKIYAHLIIACIKFTPTCVILIDRKNPEEQLYSDDSFSVKKKKIFLHRNCRNNEN